MKLQVISLTEYAAEIVLKQPGFSRTLHLQRERGRYRDLLGQTYDLTASEPTPLFLAEWYGRRALAAIYGNDRNVDALVRTAIRYAVRVLDGDDQKAA